MDGGAEEKGGKGERGKGERRMGIDGWCRERLRSRAMNSTRHITVVAAVIHDAVGRILLTRRPDNKHMGGLWEFPGGKIHDGESPAAALVRELHEELGVEASIGRPITFAVHEEPSLRILLLFYAAELHGGHLAGREGQDIRWVTPSELTAYPVPPADAELMARLADGSLP